MGSVGPGGARRVPVGPTGGVRELHALTGNDPISELVGTDRKAISFVQSELWLFISFICYLNKERKQC